MESPLTGYVVFDFTRHLSGPFATMLLHDLGADVIKFEGQTGDPARRVGPIVGSDSAYFHPINRGKRSVIVDLKAPADIQEILRLVRYADCVVENFRPGVMTRLGLGPGALQTINPRLVYASCSGFGATGPLSGLQAFDVIVQAMGGIMSVTGPAGSPPTRVGVSQADIVGGIFTALAVSAALVGRERSGVGAVIDLSMYECQLMLLIHALGIASATGTTPGRLGNRHPVVAPFDVFPASDGDVAIAVVGEGTFQNFCRVLDLDALAEDERFASNDSRVENVAALTEAIASKTRQLSKAELTERLNLADIPCGPVATVAEVLSDPHLTIRNAIHHVVPWGDRAEGIDVPTLPFLLNGERLMDPSPAPELGEIALQELESHLKSRSLAREAPDV